eukprot:151421-Hanusia_phi.AAC.1
MSLRFSPGFASDVLVAATLPLCPSRAASSPGLHPPTHQSRAGGRREEEREGKGRREGGRKSLLRHRERGGSGG